ncbi:hypothetical protein BD413DRAFT_473376 [Trametes elegans]|nr:hypothetical protein BD413DRAFT_473376 [Trametes elegans]
MTVESGHTYRLVHARTGTVLDLSMKDWRSVSSSTWDASDNQKWVAERTSHGWTLRSVATGLFLGADGIPRPGAPVVGTREEAAWDLQSRGPSVHRHVLVAVYDADGCADAETGAFQNRRHWHKVECAGRRAGRSEAGGGTRWRRVAVGARSVDGHPTCNIARD